jgi:hypothetical protein
VCPVMRWVRFGLRGCRLVTAYRPSDLFLPVVAFTPPTHPSRVPRVGLTGAKSVNVLFTSGVSTCDSFSLSSPRLHVLRSFSTLPFGMASAGSLCDLDILLRFFIGEATT